MYTRCSECGTVFRVTATVLQMAEGQVCCGNCGVNFNALAALYDQPPGEGDAAVARPAPVIPEPAMPDPALEFDVPEQEWNRFFFDTGAISAPPDQRAVPALGEDFDGLAEPVTGGEAADADRAAAIGTEAAALEQESPDADAWEVLIEDAGQDDVEDGEPLYVISQEDENVIAVREEPEPAAAAEPVSPEPGIDDVTPAEPPEPPGWPDDQDWPTAVDRDVPEVATGDSPGTVLEWGAPTGLLQSRTPQPRRVAGWLAGSTVLALLLAAQLVHYNRDALAADMRYGRFLRTGYARLNQPLYPSWPLESYEIRGAEAIAGRTAPGALDVVAQIAVRGKQPVGLPMVRLVLRDRWSNAVGSRLLAPAEFLPEPQSPSRIYAPGAVIPVLISVADPGPAAQGYEIDVCRPDRYRGLQCQSAGDPFRRSD